MKKLFNNVHVDGAKVYSYTTHVATIDFENKTLTEHGKYSPTTGRHISKVANHYGLDVIYADKDNKPKFHKYYHGVDATKKSEIK